MKNTSSSENLSHTGSRSLPGACDACLAVRGTGRRTRGREKQRSGPGEKRAHPAPALHCQRRPEPARRAASGRRWGRPPHLGAAACDLDGSGDAPAGSTSCHLDLGSLREPRVQSRPQLRNRQGRPLLSLAQGTCRFPRRQASPALVLAAVERWPCRLAVPAGGHWRSRCRPARSGGCWSSREPTRWFTCAPASRTRPGGNVRHGGSQDGSCSAEVPPGRQDDVQAEESMNVRPGQVHDQQRRPGGDISAQDARQLRGGHVSLARQLDEPERAFC
jgi:hypothetical protein